MPGHKAYIERLQAFALPAWEELPDLGLYMDQVITYLERQYRPLYADSRRIITPAMINNYVKGGLIPRPAGKKYDRSQLALLMIICALKQSLSLDDMRRLLDVPSDGIPQLYEAYRSQQDNAKAAFSSLPEHITPMQCAVQGTAYTLLCLELLRDEPDISAE